MKKILIFFCTFIIVTCQLLKVHCFAQSDSIAVHTESVGPMKEKKIAYKDSLQTKKHNPKTASWLALIPGAGQIYNRKYWKLPIVYGGLGVTSYLIYYYQGLTTLYKNEYVARLNYYEDPSIDKRNPIFEKIPDVNIQKDRNDYRKNMEICIAACAIVYALSILDACVDAHFYYYDVSDNLALGVRPKVDINPVYKTAMPCMALVLKF